MKSVMWIQSDKSDENDHLFIDGVLVSDEDISNSDEATRILFEAQESKYTLSGMTELRESLESPNFTLGYGSTMGFLYKSVFNEKAVDGRYKAFVLWCDKSEMENFWTIAERCASQVHYSLREKEREVVQNGIRRIKTGNTIKSIIGFFLILLFLAYVSTKCFSTAGGK